MKNQYKNQYKKRYKNQYNTSQRTRLTEYLKSHSDEELTSEQILIGVGAEFIGKSTVYRLISKMCANGELVRSGGSDGKKTFYRYVNTELDCGEHFHLKCVGCGKIKHLECGLMKKLEIHIEKEHGFMLDPGLTVIYGVCAECSDKRNGETK